MFDDSFGNVKTVSVLKLTKNRVGLEYEIESYVEKPRCSMQYAGYFFERKPSTFVYLETVYISRMR